MVDKKRYSEDLAAMIAAFKAGGGKINTIKPRQRREPGQGGAGSEVLLQSEPLVYPEPSDLEVEAFGQLSGAIVDIKKAFNQLSGDDELKVDAIRLMNLAPFWQKMNGRMSEHLPKEPLAKVRAVKLGEIRPTRLVLPEDAKFRLWKPVSKAKREFLGDVLGFMQERKHGSRHFIVEEVEGFLKARGHDESSIVGSLDALTKAGILSKINYKKRGNTTYLLAYPARLLQQKLSIHDASEFTDVQRGRVPDFTSEQRKAVKLFASAVGTIDGVYADLEKQDKLSKCGTHLLSDEVLKPLRNLLQKTFNDVPGLRGFTMQSLGHSFDEDGFLLPTIGIK
ncbi:MAG: hypothetical protein AB8B83_00830 [Bdellovibrionales bacterium]